VDSRNQLEFDEIAQRLSDKGVSDRRPEIRTVYESIAKDRGLLSAADFYAALGKLGCHLDKKEAAQLMACYDHKQTGFIGYDSFEKLMLRQFDSHAHNKPRDRGASKEEGKNENSAKSAGPPQLPVQVVRAGQPRGMRQFDKPSEQQSSDSDVSPQHKAKPEKKGVPHAPQVTVTDHDGGIRAKANSDDNSEDSDSSWDASSRGDSSPETSPGNSPNRQSPKKPTDDSGVTKENSQKKMVVPVSVPVRPGSPRPSRSYDQPSPSVTDLPLLKGSSLGLQAMEDGGKETSVVDEASGNMDDSAVCGGCNCHRGGNNHGEG